VTTHTLAGTFKGYQALGCDKHTTNIPLSHIISLNILTILHTSLNILVPLSHLANFDASPYAN